MKISLAVPWVMFCLISFPLFENYFIISYKTKDIYFPTPLKHVILKTAFLPPYWISHIFIQIFSSISLS